MSINLNSLSSAAEHISQKTAKLRRVRRGNKISRALRPIFGHKRLRQIVGTNLAAVAIVSSTLPQASAYDNEPFENVVIQVENTKVETDLAVSWPTESRNINQWYSWYHPGIDIDGLTGDDVVAIKDGEVIDVSWSRFAYGNAVLVVHDDGLTSLYAHLSRITVEPGQTLEAGEKLGEMGSTGRSTGDHLHLEVRENGRFINPLTIVSRQ